MPRAAVFKGSFTSEHSSEVIPLGTEIWVPELDVTIGSTTYTLKGVRLRFCKSSGAIGQCLFVKASGVDTVAQASDPDAEVCYGIALAAASAADKYIWVAVGGQALLKSGGAFSVGARVKTDANGKGVAATISDTPTGDEAEGFANFPVVALEAASAADEYKKVHILR